MVAALTLSLRRLGFQQPLTNTQCVLSVRLKHPHNGLDPSPTTLSTTVFSPPVTPFLYASTSTPSCLPRLEGSPPIFLGDNSPFYSPWLPVSYQPGGCDYTVWSVSKTPSVLQGPLKVNVPFLFPPFYALFSLLHMSYFYTYVFLRCG